MSASASINFDSVASTSVNGSPPLRITSCKVVSSAISSSRAANRQGIEVFHRTENVAESSSGNGRRRASRDEQHTTRIFLQQSRLPLGQIVVDRINAKSRHHRRFVSQWQNLSKQRIVRVARPHPGHKPARDEQRKLSRRRLPFRRKFLRQVQQPAKFAGSRTASFIASCHEAYRGAANLGRTIGGDVDRMVISIWSC